jgi:hypothetical protein
LNRKEPPMTRPILIVLAAVLAGAAFAQDADLKPPDSEDGRYSFHRVNDSFVRLDGRTGHVSVCGRESNGWACRAVPDERAALEEAIGRLQGDNATLKRELLARGLSLPSGIKADPPAIKDPDKAKPADPAPPAAKLPSDAEFDRIMSFVERVWRRLVEMMVELQRDIQRKS